MPTKQLGAFTLWERYFSRPATYAPDYTRGSRNFVNVGLGSLIVAVVIYSLPLFFFDFAFEPSPSEGSDRFRRHEGELISMKTGFRQVGFCIASTASRSNSPCVSPSAPMKGNPEMIGKHAVGYLVPGLGIVDLTLDGTKVLKVRDCQDEIQKDIYKFFGLLAFAALMFGIAFLRQAYLVADHEASE